MPLKHHLLQASHFNRLPTLHLSGFPLKNSPHGRDDKLQILRVFLPTEEDVRPTLLDPLR